MSLNPCKPALDFTLTVPSCTSQSASNYQFPYLNVSDPCYAKLHRVPLVNQDKLHPSKAEPYAEYVDEGLWKCKVSYRKDVSPIAKQFKLQAQFAEKSGAQLQNLDSVCQDELKRRFPHYQKITGVKAALKDKFPALIRWIMGTEGFHNALTSKEISRLKKQISFSACDRDDLVSTPQIQDSSLRAALNIKDDSLLQTEHIFAKNSPLNGKCFTRDGKIIHLSQGIACTSDRTVENTGNLRLVQTKDKESICYTGRPDNEHKAMEQATFIFFNELKTARKGITEIKDAQGHSVYQIDYVVNSLLSAPWVWSKDSPLASFPEREYLENELKALVALKNKGYLKIANPDAPGTFVFVKFNPILFSQSLNGFNRLEKWLPPFVTGQSRSQEISETAFSSLEQLASHKIQELQKTLATLPKGKQHTETELKIYNIQSCLKDLLRHEKENDLQPLEEILIRNYLCKLLNLPVVDHCKSSLDRTGVLVAIGSALKQWMDLKLPFPVNLRDLLKDWRFKELFALNWMAGHQITRYTCNRKGTVAGEKLKTKILGYTVHRGLYQNSSVTTVLPERYLKSFPVEQKVKMVALYLLMIIPTSLFVYLPLLVATAIRHFAYVVTLGKNSHWIGPRKFALHALLPTLYFKFLDVFPDKILNEDSPQVKDRMLIAEDKKH